MHGRNWSRLRGDIAVIHLPSGFYDPDTHRLHGPEGERHFTPMMHRILTVLADAKGRTVTHAIMIEHLWMVNDEPDNADKCIKVMICYIRRAMRAVGISRDTVGTTHHFGYFLNTSSVGNDQRSRAHSKPQRSSTCLRA